MKTFAKAKTVHGIGINDADYAVTTKVNGKLVICPFYRTWASMINRAYGRKLKEIRPTYIGCSISSDWHSFMSFRSWMLTQDWEGKALDKDLLVRMNKQYGPSFCVFVSQQLNSFTNERAAARGDHPIGVDYCKQTYKFRARCSNPFTCKNENLGYFNSPQEAHEAWRKRKHEHACRLAEAQTDIRVASALLTRYSQ